LTGSKPLLTESKPLLVDGGLLVSEMYLPSSSQFYFNYAYWCPFRFPYCRLIVSRRYPLVEQKL
jgi:hypothetical protein